MRDCIISKMMWAFSCIKYPNNMESFKRIHILHSICFYFYQNIDISDLTLRIKSSDKMLQLLMVNICDWITANHSEKNWQTRICFQYETLSRYKTLQHALVANIKIYYLFQKILEYTRYHQCNSKPIGYVGVRS